VNAKNLTVIKGRIENAKKLTAMNGMTDSAKKPHCYQMLNRECQAKNLTALKGRIENVKNCTLINGRTENAKKLTAMKGMIDSAKPTACNQMLDRECQSLY